MDDTSSIACGRRHELPLFRVLDIAMVPPDLIAGSLPTARSVVVAALPYACRPPAVDDGHLRGTIAPYTWANFYRVLRDRLRAFGREVGGRTALSVNGRLAEKPLAVLAGLGGYGGHSVVVTPEYGSLVVLGVLLCETSLSPTAIISATEERSPVERSPCLACGACIDACPTGALVAPGRLDRSRCLQALCTVDAPLSPDVMAVWGTRLYGCSTCQDACPLNAAVPRTAPLPDRGRVGPSLPLVPLLDMDDDAYRSLVAGNQMAARWVSPSAIRRNAMLALAHHGSAEATAALQRLAGRDLRPSHAHALSWGMALVAVQSAHPSHADTSCA